MFEIIAKIDSIVLIQYIQRHKGEKVDINNLIKAFNQTAIINCNSKCELDELQLCVNRDDQTGLPKQLIQCPLGATITSDSCQKAQCEYVLIPLP